MIMRFLHLLLLLHKYLHHFRSSHKLKDFTLATYLAAFSSINYKPLADKEFEHITLKNVFLLALGIAAPMSEIPAVPISRVSFKHTLYGKVFLGLR